MGTQTGMYVTMCVCMYITNVEEKVGTVHECGGMGLYQDKLY